MVFSSEIFLLLFLPTTLLVYYVIRTLFPSRMTVANVWLLGVSILFYAWGEPVYVVLMILSICMNYLFGRWVSNYPKSKKGKQIVALACVFNLGLLFVFKYLGWILGIAVKGYSGRFANLPLPIGISFYTFQALSYVVDVYRKKNGSQKNILTVGLYIAFFPQLIAGPIVKYSTVAEQLNSRKESFDKFSEGVWRFCTGLVKKILLANQLAVFAEWTFAHSGNDLTVVMAWVGALAFMLQIYFDFSGYSDMAIGLGKMFGFEFLENFNYPFVSVSISEYWRRWHISLGEWFRVYLFYPLSMGPGLKIREMFAPKVGRKKAGIIASVFALFITWMATGVWHGANMTFVVWGLVQFFFLFTEQFRKPLKNKKLDRALGHVKTVFICVVGGVVFNAASLGHALQYYSDMLPFFGNKFIDAATVYWIGQYGLVILMGTVFSFPVIPMMDRLFARKAVLAITWDAVKMIVMMVLLIVSLAYSISGGYNPFIYFNF